MTAKPRPMPAARGIALDLGLFGDKYRELGQESYDRLLDRAVSAYWRNRPREPK